MASATPRQGARSRRKNRSGSAASMQHVARDTKEMALEALEFARGFFGDSNQHRHSVATFAAAHLQAAALIYAASELATAIRAAGLVESAEELNGQQ